MDRDTRNIPTRDEARQRYQGSSSAHERFLRGYCGNDSLEPPAVCADIAAMTVTNCEQCGIASLATKDELQFRPVGSSPEVSPPPSASGLHYRLTHSAEGRVISVYIIGLGRP